MASTATALNAPATATEFRKNLFQTLDLAIQGQTIQILYKGVLLRLAAAEGGSKLARAIPRDALVVDPDQIIHSDAQLMQALETKWKAEDEQL